MWKRHWKLTREPFPGGIPYISNRSHDEAVARLVDTIETGGRRATVRAAVPEAREAFSYGMPGFTLGGRPLVWVAAWKRHYSLYPVSAAQVAALAPPGAAYEVAKGTVRFRADAPLPYDLVARLARARVGELAAEDR